LAYSKFRKYYSKSSFSLFLELIFCRPCPQYSISKN
jgi:hypothetical protein